MRCPEREVWLTVATGERNRPDRLLRHLERCPGCRREYEAARRAVRVGFPALARGVGWTPAEPDRRTREILAAVRGGERPERRVRPAPAPAPVSTLRRRLALGAAVGVVVMLVVLTARILGEWNWTGRLEISRGALLLADGENALRAAHAGEEVGPGQIVVVPPESDAEIRSAELGRVVLRGPAVLATGAGGDEPALWIARGTILLRSSPPEGVRIAAADRKIVVRGGVEIAVRSDRGPGALRWARARAAESRSTGLLGVAGAFAAPAPLLAQVDVHCLTGQISLPDGDRPLARGEEATLASDVSIRWSGEQELYAPGPFGTLTSEETERMEDLLSAGDDAVGSLLAAAEDSDRDPAERELAIWLLAEIGEGARVIPPLARVFGDAETPPSVKAAAVRTLGVLGDRDKVVSVKVLRDGVRRSPVVDEALVQALDRTGTPAARGNLAEYFGEADRPTFSRLLAAAAVVAAGDETSRVTAESLVALLHDREGRAALPAIVHLLAETPDPAGRPALLDLARAPGPARAYAFDELARRHWPGAEDAAEAALLSAAPSPALDLAAMNYLGAVDRSRADDIAQRLLLSDDRSRDLPALRGLAFSHAPEGLPPAIVARLRAIVADPESAEEFLVPALEALGTENDVKRLLELAATAPVGVRHQVFEELAKMDRSGTVVLPKSEAYFDVLLDGLVSTDALVRGQAWRGLAERFPLRALAHARSWLDEAAPSLRFDCLNGLVTLSGSTNGGFDHQTLVELLGRILDESPDALARRRTIGTLERLARARVAGADRVLLDWLERHPAPSEDRRRVLTALAKNGSPLRATEPLVAAIETGGSDATATALALLDRGPSTETTRLGARILERAESPLAKLVGALLVGNDRRAAEALGEGDEEVWCVALLRLAPGRVSSFGDEIVTRMPDASRAFRILAAFALAGDERTTELAASLARDDDDPLVRVAALLGRIGRPRPPSAKELRGAIEDAIDTGLVGSGWSPDPPVSVEESRSRIRGLRPVRRLEESLQGFSRFSSGPNVSRAIARIEERSADLARRDLSDRHDRADVRAVEVLGRVGGRGDVTRLLDFLSSRNSRTAGAARVALARLLGRETGDERAGRATADWWSQRAFALDVPLVRRRQ